MQKRFIAVLFAAALGLSSCGTVSSAALSASGGEMVGQPTSALFAAKGAPQRTVAGPNGATIYVYETHNLHGATFCEGSFFERGGVIVGFSAHGEGVTCGGSAGTPY